MFENSRQFEARNISFIFIIVDAKENEILASTVAQTVVAGNEGLPSVICEMCKELDTFSRKKNHL